MLTLILGRGKSGKTRLLLEKVKSCGSAAMASRIVIVPEQLSHETERLLSELCGDAISYVSEVLSFTRLYDRVCSVSGGGARAVLDQGGRILTARQALEGIRPQLKVFASAAGRPEFLGSMVSMIDELKSYGVTPAVLGNAAQETTGLFSEKLRELALILGSYEAACAQGAGDPRDHLTLLRKYLLRGDYAQGRSFFVDGFTDFSGQELLVLEALLRQGCDMTITVPWDPEDPLFAPGQETVAALIRMGESVGVDIHRIDADYHRPLPQSLALLERRLMGHTPEQLEAQDGAVQVIAAGDPLEECRACGAILRKHAMEGARYRDMAVCCGSESVYGPLLAQVLAELEVPLYRTEKKPVLAHPVARFLLLALECAAEGMETETVLAYLKTGYPGLEPDQLDALENYIITWGLRGSRFFAPFTMHPDGLDGRVNARTSERLQALSQWRDQSLGPLKALSTALRSTMNVSGQLRALYDFLLETHIYEKLERQVSEETHGGDLEAAQETAQIWSILLECLQQTASVLGKLSLKSHELLRVLELALGQYQVGTIPAVLDAVSFGSVSSMRGKEPKILCVLGANQGLMPQGASGGSLLSEAERRSLRERFQITLAPDDQGTLQRQLLELYGAFTAPTSRLYVLYAAGGVEDPQPCFLVDRLRSIFPGCDSAAPMATGLSPRAAAQLCLSATAENGGIPLAAAISRAAHTVPGLEHFIQQGRLWAQPRDTQVSEPVARKLFGDPVGLSASKLDQFADCPMKFFMQFGLKAMVRKESTFDASEFGTFVHFILEKSVPELVHANHALDPSESLQLVASHMEDYRKDRLSRVEQTCRQDYLLDRNSREAALLIQEISKELLTTDFIPCEYELHIGGDHADVPPLTIQGRKGRGALTGMVDRTDLWHGPDGDYIRIIDYKTGKKEFDYTALNGGSGMQMLLYLFTLTSAGIPGLSQRPKPAGTLYFPASRAYQAVSSPTDPRAQEKPKSRSGVVLGEDAVLEAMEHGGSYQYLPVRKTKNGLGNYVLSAQQFALLERYVRERMAKVTDEILSGNLGPKPFYRGAAHDPCTYCDYGAVCQKDPSFRKSCYQAPVSAKQFWELLQEGETEE